MTDSPKPVAHRPGGRTARVRAQVLDATVLLVARHGITGFSYEEVADLAGVHKMTVYRNWPDRDRLVSEAIMGMADETVPLEDTGDLRRDLTDFLVALATVLASPTGRALTQAIQAAHDNPDVRHTVDLVATQRLALLQDRTTSATERGELPRVDPRFLADLLAGPVHLHLTRQPDPFTREDAERIVDVVLAGIRATVR